MLTNLILLSELVDIILGESWSNRPFFLIKHRVSHVCNNVLLVGAQRPLLAKRVRVKVVQSDAQHCYCLFVVYFFPVSLVARARNRHPFTIFYQFGTVASR